MASYDGKVEIIKIKKNENPFLVKSVPTRDNILSICFENSTNNIFYTGHSNGIINKLNLQTGQTILSINTSLNIKKTEEKNMIWTLCSINSQFLFAGDSTGRVLILDMKVGNINQEINEHKGDILTMCFNNNFNNHFYNNIGEIGASFLSEALKTDSSITSLNLSMNYLFSFCCFYSFSVDNNIGDSGACSISEALKMNSSVTTLDLEHCLILLL